MVGENNPLPPPLERLRLGDLGDNGVVNHSPSEQIHTVHYDTTKSRDMREKKEEGGILGFEMVVGTEGGNLEGEWSEGAAVEIEDTPRGGKLDK